MVQLSNRGPRQGNTVTFSAKSKESSIVLPLKANRFNKGTKIFSHFCVLVFLENLKLMAYEFTHSVHNVCWSVLGYRGVYENPEKTGLLQIYINEKLEQVLPFVNYINQKHKISTFPLKLTLYFHFEDAKICREKYKFTTVIF